MTFCITFLSLFYLFNLAFVRHLDKFYTANILESIFILYQSYFMFYCEELTNNREQDKKIH